MIDAHTYNNDIVFIKPQPSLEMSEIGAILVDENIMLKRFYKTNDSVILQSANSNYPPQIYTNESQIKYPS